jgi:ribosomal protein S18 acetylase RimI-like enzyme
MISYSVRMRPFPGAWVGTVVMNDRFAGPVNPTTPGSAGTGATARRRVCDRRTRLNRDRAIRLRASTMPGMATPATSPSQLPQDTRLRHDLKPGDLGQLIWLHGTVYAREYGFDPTFEAYVAGPLAKFVGRHSDRDRLWIAERGAHIMGCIAIVGASHRQAQLRWFLVVPSARGQGLGRALLHEAVEFCERQAYECVFLWTVSALTAAAGLYRRFGFEKVEEHPGHLWGVDVIEEKYLLRLASRA